MKTLFMPFVVVALIGCATDQGGSSDWMDLLPTKDLKGWKRYPLDPSVPLAAKAVYKVSDDGRMLIVDATGGIKEVLINDEERGDGIFHVEWRWGKDQGEKPNYNGGIYLRSAPDGKTWIQAQVAKGAKPPGVGDLIGMLMADGKPTRTDKLQAGPSREAPVGDWNTYDVTCRGKKISLAV